MIPVRRSTPAILNTQRRTARSPFLPAFVLVTSLFFMWAVAHNLNDVLIKHFQNALQLSRTQASFIQVSFYVAYFVFALPAGHLMRRVGLKGSMVTGLFLYAAGAVAFWPAAKIGTYPAFLFALFVIASGIICLEISASAFMVLSGAAQNSAFRINLAQAFNGLGAVVAPIIGGLFILRHNPPSPIETAALSGLQLTKLRALELQQVQLPYLIIGSTALGIAALLLRTRFPQGAGREPHSPVRYGALLRDRVFAMAVCAEFFYVGAQVGTWSFFIDFVQNAQSNVSARSAAFLLSGSLMLFMLGRFSGSWLIRRIAASKLLIVYAVLAATCLALAVSLSGYASIGCLMSVSFFMSIMYPTIFDLGLKAAGEQARIGAAFIVMSIVGGAVIPPVLGLIADKQGIRHAYWALIPCFMVILLFGWMLQRPTGALRTT